MKTKVSLKCFVSYCLWKRFFDLNSFQIPSNVISLTISETVKPFTKF